jgi:hypothetical protein
METAMSLLVLSHRSRADGAGPILLKVYLGLCVGALLLRLIVGLVHS